MFNNTIVARLKQNRFFSEFFTESAMKQFQKYLIVGFTTLGIEYSLFAVSYELLRHSAQLKIDDTIKALLANIVGYSISFVYNFLMNRYWSFQSTSSLSKQLLQYGILFGFNLLASCGIIYLFSDIFGLIPYISKLLAMGAIVSWNFVFYKKIIYRN